MKKRAFGDLEISILQILKSKKRVTVKAVQEALGSEDKYTTVMTVMQRLFEKKILSREKIGPRYEYWLTETPSTPKTIFERLHKKLFGIRPAEVVSYLVNEAEALSLEDLDEIEKIILSAKNKGTSHE